MLLENQWFWLVMIAFFVIMYLIISKVCETIENIRISKNANHNFSDKKYDLSSYTVQFHSLEELEEFIDSLLKYRDEIIEKESKEDNK